MASRIQGITVKIGGCRSEKRPAGGERYENQDVRIIRQIKFALHQGINLLFDLIDGKIKA